MVSVFVRFINKNQVVIFFWPIILIVVQYLVQASIANKTGMFIETVGSGYKPSFLSVISKFMISLHLRINNQYFCTQGSIGNQESFGYHCSDNSFSKTYNIGKHKPIMV